MSAPPEYKDAADHFTMCSSSADKVRSSNRFEVKDFGAIPAACKIETSTPNQKATNVSHHLILDKFVGCSDHLFEGLVPFARYALEASTRDPLGYLSHYKQSGFGSNSQNAIASRDGMMSTIQAPVAVDLENWSTARSARSTKGSLCSLTS